MKKGAIFDMDGLLLDTEKIYQDGWVKLAPRFTEHPNAEVPEACSGSAGDRVLKILESYYPGVDGKAYLEGVIAYYTAHVEDDMRLKPGVVELLTYFQSAGVKLAVASSTFLSQIYRNLEIAGIASYFGEIVSSLDVANNKPAPDVFLKAASGLALQPEDCYVFEDAINGVKAGLCAGCSTVMIPDSQQPLPQFYEECAGIFPSLNEALAEIKSGRL